MSFKAMILPFLLLLFFNNLATAFPVEESLLEIDFPEVKLNHTQKTHDAFFNLFCSCAEYEPQLVEKSKKISYELISKNKKALVAGAFLKTFLKFESKDIEEQRNIYQRLMQKKNSLLKLSSIGLRYIYLDSIFRTPLGEKITGFKVPSEIQEFNQSVIQDFSETILPRFKKNHLNFSQDELKLKEQELDYLIVGSGPAAAVVAFELVHKGYQVMMVEQGPFIVPHSVKTTQLVELKESRGARLAKGSGIIIKNGQTAGGGTTVNIDLAFPPTEDSVQYRLNQWVKEGKVDANLFQFSNVSKAYEWVKEKIGTRAVEENEINANNQVLWDGSLLIGSQPKRYHLNRERETHKKLGALEKLIIPALLHPKTPLSFLGQVRVDRILFDSSKKQAIGVECQAYAPWPLEGMISALHGESIPQDRSFTIKAKNIILSAGSLGSSLILQKSSSRFKSSGKGVILHPSMAVLGVFDKKIENLEGLTTGVFNDTFVTDPEEGYIFESASAYPWTIAGGIFGKDIKETFQIMERYNSVAGFGVMLVDSVNRKNKVDLNLLGRGVVHYEISQKDQVRLKKGLKKASLMMFKAGAKKLIIPTFESNNIFLNYDQAAKTIDQLEFKKFQNAISSAHMQSTNKMGADPETSVVDYRFRAWERTNLYIVDSSVFPTSVGANPMQTIYTIGKIFADTIQPK